MRRQQHTEDIIELIDRVVPPSELGIVQEVQGIIQPQLDAIVALSGLAHVVDRRDFIDTHHLFYPRTDYSTRLQKTFRRAFVIPINRGVHDEVHATIEPPQLPNKSTMLAYLMHLDKKEKRAT